MATESHQSKFNVAILLYDGVELLDFAGPGEVFERADGGRAFNVYTVGTTTEAIISQGFVKVIPEYSVDTSPAPDILVIPGGVRFSTLENQAITNWVAKVANTATINLSVCTGSFLFAKVGLLNAQKATTHQGSIDNLREFAPEAEILNDARYVDNGHVITAAGVSAVTHLYMLSLNYWVKRLRVKRLIIWNIFGSRKILPMILQEF